MKLSWILTAVAAVAAAGGRWGATWPLAVLLLAWLAGCAVWAKLRPSAPPRWMAAAGMLLLLLVPLSPSRPLPELDMLVAAGAVIAVALLVREETPLAGHGRGLVRAGCILAAVLGAGWGLTMHEPWRRAIESEGAYSALAAIPVLAAIGAVLAVRTLLNRRVADA